MIHRIGPEQTPVVARLEELGAAWPWSADAIRSSLAAPTCRAWLAVGPGGPVGHLLATAAADTGEVLTIVVHPASRRSGWGRLLLGACAATWREEHVQEAFLEVRAGNAPAIGLYQILGWSEVGRRRRYYPDGEDAVVMRWGAPC